MLLSRFTGFEVVGEAANGRDAIRQAEELHPDVVLMDLTMPDLNGFDATAEITRLLPDTRVLIVSMHAHEEYVTRALRAGASGYVVKEAGGEELARAVRAVAEGDTYVSPELGGAETHVNGEGQSLERYDRLTPRHREVLQLVAEGYTTREIAERLGISVKTVEAHRSEIMRRLGIHELAGLVRFAVRLGIVQA
jgi:DNA-binding NarL/FixJ family response regulator